MLGESNRLYQASSIHARQRMSPRTSYIDTGSPLPTPPPPPATNVLDQRTEREKRLIADLWLTSAATFRRMGKLEQARAAIQEAETLDEGNPGLWVQVCQTSIPYDSVLKIGALTARTLFRCERRPLSRDIRIP